MPQLPCPHCGYIVRVHGGVLRSGEASCPKCRARIVPQVGRQAKPRSRAAGYRWQGMTLLALALALAAPAVWAVVAAGGDLSVALHGSPERDFARYALLAAPVAAVLGILLMLKRRRGRGRWVM